MESFLDQEILFSSTNILFDAELFSYLLFIDIPDISSICHFFVDRELMDGSGELGVSFYVLDGFWHLSVSDFYLAEQEVFDQSVLLQCPCIVLDTYFLS